MKLSIITINFNNAPGLRKTIESVVSQTSRDFEYIVIDGGSTDGSVEVIKENSDNITFWVSEPDNGIYQAMNKGIRVAKGEYCQFLNSGDWLAAPDVTERMLRFLYSLPSMESDTSEARVSILYGNMLKPLPKRVRRDRGLAGQTPTMFDFFSGTLNHSPTYIKRNLFDSYGFYDETLRIVSDWKWYLQVIILKNVIPVYVDMDVTVFDMQGISNINSSLNKAERHRILKELLPASILSDYDQFAFPIEQLKRINSYWLTRKGFWLVERILFKWEKWFKLESQLLYMNQIKANNISRNKSISQEDEDK